ncbi:AtpZ/AtpI family protein [Acidimangrovimonas pyrenivorans]|uniref:ATP synthase protein I n=1 Tax=Acidimangrovimonas pyrenivorans TaxID=2030798 RepID=A0ABV7AJE7_9RHOB
MVENDEKERLQRFEERLAKAKQTTAPKPTAATDMGKASTAWRMITELVAGIGIGFGIGYGLDSLFGTMPLFLVLFIFFGFAAGIKVMLRTAAELNTETGAAEKAAEDEGD